MPPPQAGVHWSFLVAIGSLVLLAGAPHGAAASKVHVVTSHHAEGVPKPAALGSSVAVSRNTTHQGGRSNSSDSGRTSSRNSPDDADWQEAGSGILEGGLQVDTIAAEAAARPAEELPAKYPVKGLIDVQGPIFSEEPGILIPLAQARSGIGSFLAALEAAGSGTPLSDPTFVGTVFIPSNEAFERVYPTLRRLQQLNQPATDAFANITREDLALQLNCLTLPGPALKYEDLVPGRMLKTAGTGVIRVLSSGTADSPARLQHLPSSVAFFLVEADLQSGNAVAHIIDTLPPAQVLTAASRAASEGPSGHYKTAVRILTDPAAQLGSFAWLVQQAGLTDLLASTSDAFTLFAPHDKAVGAFMAELAPAARQRLLSNTTLADQLVSAHLVLGMALGSKALEALLPAGHLRTPQGSLRVAPAAGAPAGGTLLPSDALAEAGVAAPPPTTKPVALMESANASAVPSPPTPAAAAAAAAAAATAAAAAAPEAAPLSPQQALLVPPGGGPAGNIAVADARILAADLVAGKAVVHIVDRVLVPPALEQELGLQRSAGYSTVAMPPPLASGAAGRQSARSALIAWAAAAAGAVLLLLG